MVAVSLRIHLRQARPDAGQVRIRPRDSDTRFQMALYGEPADIALFEKIVAAQAWSHRDREEQGLFDILIEACELLGSDADDSERHTVDPDGGADDGRIGVPLMRPKVMAQHHYRVASEGLVFCFQKVA